MQNAQWFIHIQGETFGPIASDVVQIMLRQNRLQFTDFVWSEGQTKWTRLSDVHHFVHLMPPYPTAPIPSPSAPIPSVSSAAAPAVSVVTPRPAPSPAAAASPVPSPRPSPQPAPVAPAPMMKSTPPPAPVAKPQGVPDTPLKAWNRRYGRVPLDGNVTVDGYGGFPIVDISEGGVFCSASAPIAFGTDLRFRLDSPSLGKPLDLTGIVIREGASEDGHAGFAVQFTRVNPAHRRVIHEYVKSKMAKQD